MSFQLFEYFNTTNQTSPYYERHHNFANPEIPERCEEITLLEPFERCDFATNGKSCLEHVYIFNYNKSFYCTCDASDLSRVVCVLILFLIGALQFWIIFVTTTAFFVPALQMISNALNLNEYIAGITIITFGNNASVLINTFFGQFTESRHMYTDEMSLSLFGSIFTASIIMWITPFAIDGTCFLRETGFVLLYITYVDFIFKLSNGDINIFRAASMVSIYVIYITVVIIDQYLQYRMDKHKTKQSEESELIDFDTQVLPPTTDLDIADNFRTANRNIFKQFFEAFDVLDRNNFHSKWTVFKLWALIKVPFLIFLRLLIPQMNTHDSPYKWSKLLLTIQLTFSPILILLALTFEVFSQVKFLTWCAISILIFLPVSVTVFILTRTDCIPKWNRYISILTIISCISVIYFVGKELVFLLESLGTILDRSHTFIGCTFYTWGKGLSDMLANISLAKKGYPRMAFFACFGVVIFNTCTSISVPVLYRATKSKTGIITLTEGTVGETTSIILIMSLIILVLYGITTNFMLRRTGALIGITLYLLFLIISITSEFELTHAFGTDHSLDRLHFRHFAAEKKANIIEKSHTTNAN